MIPSTDMSTLQTKAVLQTNSSNAMEEASEMAVAAAVNHASNTGEHKVVYQSPISDTLKAKLEAAPYEYTLEDYGNRGYVISWE